MKVFTFDSDVLIDLFPRIYLFSLFDAKEMTETSPCRFIRVFVSFFPSVSVLIFLPIPFIPRCSWTKAGRNVRGWGET